jgi:hypothetical protein
MFIRTALLALPLLMAGCAGCQDPTPPAPLAPPANQQATQQTPSPDAQFSAGAAMELIYDKAEEVAKGLADPRDFYAGLSGPLNEQTLALLGLRADQFAQNGYELADYTLRFEGRALSITLAAKGGRGGNSFSRSVVP